LAHAVLGGVRGQLMVHCSTPMLHCNIRVLDVVTQRQSGTTTPALIEPVMVPAPKPPML
jgi:hypothetical protein